MRVRLVFCVSFLLGIYAQSESSAAAASDGAAILFEVTPSPDDHCNTGASSKNVSLQLQYAARQCGFSTDALRPMFPSFGGSLNISCAARQEKEKVGELRAGRGIPLTRPYRSVIGWFKLTVPPMQVESTMSCLRELREVKTVERDLTRSLTQASPLPSDTYLDGDGNGVWDSGTWGNQYENLWGLKTMHVEAAWSQGIDGAGVTVGLVDSGIDLNHPELVNNLWTNQAEATGSVGVDDDGNGYIDDLHGYSFAYNNAHPQDVLGHGTHVAGIIAAEQNGIGIVGVSPKVKVIAAKVFTDTGQSNESDQIEAVQYVTAMGADVINCSYGGSSPSAAEEAAFQLVADVGVIAVCAAGNNAADTKTKPFYPSSYASTIGVGAITPTFALSWFSNYGISVDVVAPGSGNLNDPYTATNHGILSLRAAGSDLNKGTSGYVAGSAFQPAFNSTALYYRANGTSMATPYVTGLVALLRSRWGGLTPEQVRYILTSTAVDLGLPGPDNTFGAGVPDIAEAIARLSCQSPGPDCDGNGLSDSCDISIGLASDCDHDGVPDMCAVLSGVPDCDDDLIPDSCEADCDGNSVPDSCELDTLVNDCNSDGVLDVCSVSAGTLENCNLNEIPDTCEEGIVQKYKLTPADGVSLDNFGSSIAIDAGTAVIGSPRHSSGATGAGAAYVERKINGAWKQLSKLVSPNPTASGLFGSAVAVDGATIAVGARDSIGGKTGVGGVYLYQLYGSGSISFIQTVLANDGGPNDRFGSSVALDNGFLFSGAPDDDTSATNQGAVYVFQAPVYNQNQKLSPVTLASNDRFGAAVAAFGDTLVIGAPGDDTAGSAVGAAYVYSKNITTGEWEFYQKLIPNPASASSQFGTVIAINENTIAISSPLTLSDAVYLFKRDQNGMWGQSAHLIPPNGSKGVEFGGSLALQGNELLVGAPKDASLGALAGRVYRYVSDSSGNWNIASNIAALVPMVQERFGSAVAWSGSDLVVGAKFGLNANSVQTGLAYAFEILPAVSCSGLSLTLWPGIPGVTNTLTLSKFPASASLYLLFGDYSAKAILVPGCQGLAIDIDPATVRVFPVDTLGQSIVQFNGEVPAELAGASVSIQAVDTANCQKSAVIKPAF